VTDFARLARLGLRTEQDLLLHLPLRYEDETRCVAIARAQAGDIVQVEGRVTGSEVVQRGRRSAAGGSGR
jgi:ATP-dependent DNA helicase RecG